MDEAVNDAKSKKKNNGLLVLASARGYLGDVQQLLEMGADANAKDKRGISALHYASGQGRLEVLQFLWSRGLDLDADDPGGRTALHWGVLGNHTEAVSFLISKGAWVEASDGNDETALHIAARSANKEVVKAVLAAAPSGRHPSIKDMNKHGLTPLGEALVAGRCDVADLLVKEGGASIEDRLHGWSLLHITAALGQRSACKWLLSRKLGVGDAESEEGFTPLHCAAMGGSLECAQLLLEAGADRNATDRGGAVPWAHVPEAAGKLRALLKPAGPAQKLPGATQASVNGVPAEQQTQDQAFANLSAAAQDSQILRWAAVEDEERLEKALAGHNPEVKKRVKDVQTTRQVLCIQHAINELHEDDDFQQDAGQLRMLGIVDEIRTSASAMANYEKDAAVMHVLKKLRRFQMIVSANGHHKVPFVDLIIAGKVGWREKDQNRVGGMRIMLERQTRAAAAAASAGRETAAKAAAEAQLAPPSASGASLAEPAPAVNGGTGPATAFAGAAEQLPSASSVSAAEGSASLDAPKIGKPKKRVSWRAGSLDDVAQASSDRAGLATPEELAQLDQPEQFTWKAFGRALAKQMLQSALMGLVFLIAMYLSGQPMPWQNSVPAAPREL